MNTDTKIGYIYGISAFSFWGFVPIYFKSVAHIEALEVLSHRIIWSVVVLFILLIYKKQFRIFLHTIRDIQKLKMLFVTALLISANWLVFIWAIAHNMILETSLGYFINPLVVIALGFLFFQEKLSALQKVAVFVACFGVLYQLVLLGSIPLVSLGLALFFAFYGMVRKKIGVASMPGLMVETVLMIPFALVYVLFFTDHGFTQFYPSLEVDALLLMLGGLVTVIPLIWFNIAASKLPYSSIGFLQYIGPSIAFLLAVFIYHEPFSVHKFISFAFIWSALVVYSYDHFKKKSKGVL